jgi:hypothetical protein
MTDTLREAADALPSADRARILADPAAPRLARTLAAAAGRGADPTTLLRAAFEFDDSQNVRSIAAVLATRIEDCPHTLGVPDEAPESPAAVAPLPWLPAPDVGHAGWLPYLQARADLIRDRANDLGSLTAAYRDQYAITDPEPSSLGEPPEPGTRREGAYRAAQATVPEQCLSSQPRHGPGGVPPTQTLAPSYGRGRSITQQRGPRLNR